MFWIRTIRVRLPKTKTGLNQSIVIEDKNLWKLFKFFLSQTTATSAGIFIPLTPAKVTKQMDRIVKSFGLSNLRFTPHCLRHGGATEDYLKGVPIDHIVHKGRWASVKSANRYIQAGRSLLLGAHLPKAVMSMARPLIDDPGIIVRDLKFR